MVGRAPVADPLRVLRHSIAETGRRGSGWVVDDAAARPVRDRHCLTNQRVVVDELKDGFGNLFRPDQRHRVDVRLTRLEVWLSHRARHAADHRCVYDARANAVDPDVGFVLEEGERTGEADDSVLGGGIYWVRKMGDEAGERSGVNDYAAAAPAHRRHDGLYPNDHRPEVYGEGLLPELEGSCRKPRLRSADAGVVVKDIDAAKGLLGDGDHTLEIVSLGDIDVDERPFPTGFFDDAYCLAAAVFIEIGDDNGGALSGQRDGCRAADTGAAASDEGYFAFGIYGAAPFGWVALRW